MRTPQIVLTFTLVMTWDNAVRLFELLESPFVYTIEAFYFHSIFDVFCVFWTVIFSLMHSWHGWAITILYIVRCVGESTLFDTLLLLQFIYLLYEVFDWLTFSNVLLLLRRCGISLCITSICNFRIIIPISGRRISLLRSLGWRL